MSNSAINSAMSGLTAAQIGINTTGNNIANVNADGYNRQTTVFTEANSTYMGAGWIGNGVHVSGVKREYNDFITRQLRDAQHTASQMETRYQQMKKIDDQIAGTHSVASSLQDFFTSLQVLVSNADDSAARQTLLGKAGALINQFKVTDDALRSQNKQINSGITASIEQINVYSRQIANLNQRISQLTAIGAGASPNDLLDQRDELVSALNKLTGVEVTAQDGKSYTVAVGNGYTLVQGNRMTELAAVTSNKDPGRFTVAYVDKLAGNVEIPENLLKTGSLGGLLDFRSQDLDQISNSLNQLARVFADKFNQQHLKGVDLYDDPGEKFFNIGEPRVLSDASNLSKTTLNAAITNSSNVQASNYDVTFDGKNWRVTRSADQAPVTLTSKDTSAAATTLEFDALRITVAGGPPAAGDSFTVKPVEEAIRGMSLLIHDPAKIASGLHDGNTGTSDNRNSQQLLDLQTAKTMNGNKSFNDAWASIISDVGNKTRIRQVTSSTQNNVVKQIVKQQQSISGVNLDEEYGSLQRYQQYYMANAKALQTASTLFDALLSAFR